VTVTATTIQGSALANKDYKTTTTTLTFAPGVTTVNFNVQIIGDLIFEPTETFTVSLSNPSANAVLVRGSATVTIFDNDPALTASVAAPAGLAVEALTSQQLDAAVAKAEAEWRTVRPNADFSGVTFTIGDLPELQLGYALDGQIVIDATAAGWGWSRMDLVSVLLHELGHTFGLEHESGGVMAETLAPGELLEGTLAAATISAHGFGSWTLRPLPWSAQARALAKRTHRAFARGWLQI
jgi:hypothetical protein